MSGEGRVCSPPQPLSAVVPPQQHEVIAEPTAPPLWLGKPLWELLCGNAPAPLAHRPAAAAPGFGNLALYGALGERAQKCQNRSDNILKKNAPPSGPGRKEMGFPALGFIGVVF